MDRFVLPVTLAASIAAHIAVQHLSFDPSAVSAEVPIDTLEQRDPMTVRLVAPPVVREPVPVTPIEEVLTSNADANSMFAPAPLDEPIRREPELERPERQETPELPPPDSLKPEIEPEEVPKPVPTPELPPEPIDLERDLPIGPVEIEEVSATEVSLKAAAKNSGNRPPRYPNRARARRLEGTVDLEVRVSPTGKPLSVAVATSSGHEILDDAAIAAVKKWKFTPAKAKDGSAVEDTVIVPVTFRWKGRR